VAVNVGTSWVVSSTRATAGGNVAYEIVTNSLQRLTVTVPRQFTDTPTAEQIIQRSIDALTVPGKPYF